MTDILNPIFFSMKSFNDEEAILSLEKYMLFHNSNVIHKCDQINNAQETIVPDKIAEKKKEEIPSIYLPRKQDTLFWCMYIAMYGYDEYTLITNHTGNKELEEKQKIMDYFVVKNRGKLRSANKKISKVKFQEMVSELMVDRKITLSVLILFVLFYDIDVLIVNKKTYMEFSSLDSGENKSVFIIHRNNDKEYEIDLDTNNEKISNIVDNYLKMECESKALKGISCYTVNELKEIYEKISDDKTEITSQTKLSKTDIYNSILIKTVW